MINNEYEGWEIDTDGGDEESGAWLSIGDLMSGLLMFFALLLIVSVTYLSDRIQQFEETRIMVIKSLADAMNAQGIDVEVDTVTGDISITDSLLFNQGEDALSPAGEVFIEKFAPAYADTIFSSNIISDEISRIIVEGHTSSEGDFIYNMDLSLRRAGSVVATIESLDFDFKEQFIKKIMPSGRGEIESDEYQELESDRRVIFRFQFRRDAYRIASLLSGEPQ